MIVMGSASNRWNKGILIPIIFVLCLFSGIFLYYQYTFERNTETNSKAEKKENSSQIEKQNDEKHLLGRADIPFSEYESIYEDQDPIILEDFEEDDCEKKEENIGWSFIELVFLEKLEDGSIRPYEINHLSFEHLEFNESCGPPPPPAVRTSTGTLEKLSSCRVKLAVSRGCKCPDTIEPGKKYSIYRFNKELSGINYKFEVPEEEKLDFVSPDSEQKPVSFRIPIFVNDIRRTKQTSDDSVSSKKETISFRNVISTEKSKLGLISKYLVSYKVEDDSYTTKGFSSDGTYKVDLNIEQRKRILGGTVEVIGVLKRKNSSSVMGLQLLMYKTDVQSKDVDMSEKPLFRYDSEETIKKEINLTPLIKKNNIDISRDELGQVVLGKILKGKNQGEKKVLKINEVRPYKKKNHWFVQLEAAPGEYVLGIEALTVLDKNFHWPPK